MTLTAVLILAVVVFLIIIGNEEQTKVSEVRVQYTKHKVTSNYIKDIENTYLPEIISTSEKLALRELSHHGIYNNNLENQLESVMTTGKLTDGTYIMSTDYTILGLRNKTIDTISFGINFTRFDFDILSISHVNSKNIRIVSEVNFTIESKTFSGIDESKVKWENVIPINDEVSIIGLYNRDQGDYMTRKWETNITRPCFLKTLDIAQSCGGSVGLCPLTGCI